MRFQPGLAVLSALILCFVTALPVRAEMLAPPWRGDSNSTLQIWWFSTGEKDNIEPEVVDNLFGTPVANIYGEFDYPKKDTQWFDKELAPHEGVWMVGSSISLEIPNDPTPRPHKLIQLQIVYDGGHSTDPAVPYTPWVEAFAPGGAPGTVELVKDEPVDSVFSLAVFDIAFQPNVSAEIIWIRPRYCNVYVDTIAVDTICVPEPPTLALAALAVLALVAFGWRRRPSR